MRFEACAERLRIDLAAECIWRDGIRYSVPPKAFLVLRYLTQRPEQLVTKAELLDAVWPDTHVVDIVLNVAIGELRQALADNPRQPRFIATVHRRGFRWIGPPASSLSGGIEDAPSTFVGRSDGLAQLEACRVRAAAGQRQIVFVTGESGIGKTAIVNRFLEALQNDAAADPLVAYGQCVDRYGAGEVYRPLLDAAEALVRAGGESIHALFRKHAPTWLLQMRDLLDAEQLAELRQGVGDSTLVWMQREIERGLEAASADRFVVLALEDLHWADAATIGLLGALAAGTMPARLLVIGTFRPFDAIASQHPIVHLKHELVHRRQCTEIALDGLTREAIDLYFDRRFAPHRLPAALGLRLHAQTSGNPLFLLNALADCEQRGWLSEREGTWEWTVDVERVGETMPDGTRALIAYRLDRLEPQTQELLEAASLAGMTFTTQVVAAATQRADDHVETECRRLAHALFLEEGGIVEWPDGSHGRQQTFRHALYRQILDERVPASRRALLHRRIAERLEGGYGKRADEVAAALSYHYERAGEVYRAVDFLEVMAQQTYPRRATHEAMLLIDHAVKLLQTLPEGEVRQSRLLHLNAALGIFSSTTVGGNHPISNQVLQTLSEAMNSRNAAEHLAPFTALVMGQMVAGRFREARRSGEELLASCGNDAPPQVLLCGHSSIGMGLYYVGEIDRALPHLEKAAAITASLPEASNPDPALSFSDPSAPNLGVLAGALTLAGRADEGAVAIEAGVAYGRRFAMPWFVGFPLSGACGLGMIRRDLVETRRRALQLQEHCAVGSPVLQATARFTLHWVEIMESRDRQLLPALREAYKEVATANNPLNRHRFLSNLADAYLITGELVQAAACLDEAFTVRGEAVFFDAELHRQRAAILLARAGKRPSGAAAKEAEELLESSMDIAARQGAHLFGLRALVDLCRLSFAERPHELQRRLSDALSHFNQALDDTDLREARALLDLFDSNSISPA